MKLTCNFLKKRDIKSHKYEKKDMADFLNLQGKLEPLT